MEPFPGRRWFCSGLVLSAKSAVSVFQARYIRGNGVIEEALKVGGFKGGGDLEALDPEVDGAEHPAEDAAH